MLILTIIGGVGILAFAIGMLTESDTFKITGIIGFVVFLVACVAMLFVQEECPNCEAKHQKLSNTACCESCGYSFKCECGVFINNDAEYCDNCGREYPKKR